MNISYILSWQDLLILYIQYQMQRWERCLRLAVCRRQLCCFCVLIVAFMLCFKYFYVFCTALRFFWGFLFKYELNWMFISDIFIPFCDRKWLRQLVTLGKHSDLASFLRSSRVSENVSTVGWITFDFTVGSLLLPTHKRRLASCAPDMSQFCSLAWLKLHRKWSPLWLAHSCFTLWSSNCLTFWRMFNKVVNMVGYTAEIWVMQVLNFLCKSPKNEFVSLNSQTHLSLWIQEFTNSWIWVGELKFINYHVFWWFSSETMMKLQ